MSKAFMKDRSVLVLKDRMEKKLKDLFIVPDYDNSKISVTFTPPAGCKSISWEVVDEKRALALGEVKAEPGKESSFEAVIENFKPWNINTPYLYTLSIKLEYAGETHDVEKKFGMRKIHAASDSIYVNNEKFYVRGYVRGLRAHDHPNYQGLSLTEYYEKNIRAAKDYGFNFIRFHSSIPHKECFEAADRLGMFIHIEIRKFDYGKDRMNVSDVGEIIDESAWREAVQELRNHPSLMVYCMGNEIKHPGINHFVAHIAAVTKALDPTRLFIDTCAHGEYDRTYVDIDVQHMSYFYPYGSNYDMFENTQNWRIYGSCKGNELEVKDKEAEYSYKAIRSISPGRPVIAHEICHYIALRDVNTLGEKFMRLGIEKPWWIDELKKLIKVKNAEKDYGRMLAASKYFQFLSWKLGIEAARRSRILSGFHFLQFCDSDRYENSNGIVDCFDDKGSVDENEFMKFNSDSVILVDLPRRTYFEGESVKIPVLISHFSGYINGRADFAFSLKSRKGSVVDIHGSLKGIDLDEKGKREICSLEIRLPEIDRAEALTLICMLKDEAGRVVMENSWNIWLYLNRPQRIPAITCNIDLDEVNLRGRYPQIKTAESEDINNLMIVNRFTEKVTGHLERGGDVLMLYRVPETRDRKVRAAKEKYCLPTTWDRFKAVIWDRGTNQGAFLRDSALFEEFPNDGFLDLQFHDLVNDCDKIVLDDFPCEVEPLMQGVDKAVRDRFDVYTYKLSEFQPEWTLRKFGYIFEIKVGQGRLLVTGLNFTGINTNQPETCAMFEALMKYAVSENFKPAAEIDSSELEKYLLEKGRAPRIKERKMTQYWQLNEEPLESGKYWVDAENYIDEG